VAPVGDPAWAGLRPNIGTPERAVKRVDDTFGLHPGLSPLFDAWDDGVLAAVHAVGQPSTSRSHAVATAELERAARRRCGPGGWTASPASATPGCSRRRRSATRRCRLAAGPRDELAVGRIANEKLSVSEDVVPLAAWQRAIGQLHADARPQVARPTSRRCAASPRCAARGRRGGTTATTSTRTAPRRRAARRRPAGAGRRRPAGGDGGRRRLGPARRRRRVDGGAMRDRLQELAQALAAFRGDLGERLRPRDGGDRQRVRAPGRGERLRRHDHGRGNAALVFGGRVRGGRVYGRWPGWPATGSPTATWR
jgi:uncharacterized protein (DUF1501 family)